jgi:tRNA-dihydrouridine synthase B
MQIGSLSIDSLFFLAPLAGYTDLPFRLLCRRFGAGLCYSEMISCNGLQFRQKSTLSLLASVPEERPVAMQLFGHEPEIMADAASFLSSLPIDIIDLNMGCPVKKVIKRGAGAALLKDLGRAAAIISAVRRATQKPLTVKIRTGWTHQSINAAEFARMAEDHGVDAIAVHGRAWSDGFGGRVDLSAIERVKNSVSVPVIGNGDLHSYEDGLAMIDKTGCDAVMIGRGALGAPWIFTPGLSRPSFKQRVESLALHLELIGRYGQPPYPLARIKNHAGRYFKGTKDASSIRRRIYTAPSFEHLSHLISLLKNAEKAPDTGTVC